MKTLTSVLLLFTLIAFLAAGDLEREFKTSSGKELKVSLIHGGSINVDGWDKEAIQVTAKIRGREIDDDDIKFRQHGGGLDITVNPRYHSRGVELFIRVPEKYNLDLETMGGDISVSNVQGEIEGKTMGGDLDFKDIKGELQFTTMGGDITMKNSEVDGNAKTMGGDLEFINVHGDIRANTMGGDIMMHNTASFKGKPSELDLSTMGGEIEVDEALLGLKAETMGGDIKIGKAANFLKVKTMGGEISVKEIDGWVEATTMGGDVSIVMTGDADKGDRHVTLSSMGGEIDLTLPSGISANFDIELTYTKSSHRDYRIKSDFPLEIDEDEDWDYDNGDPRKVIRGTGKTGGGKHDIRIETINGNVTIRKQ